MVNIIIKKYIFLFIHINININIFLIGKGKTVMHFAIARGDKKIINHLI